MHIKIQPEKLEYFPNEILKGVIKIYPKSPTKIKDIEMSFMINEDWKYDDSEGNCQNNNNINIFSFNIGVCSFLQKPENTLIDLEKEKEYCFPFEKQLPDYLLPSFEFVGKYCKAFLRYIFRAKVITENNPEFCNMFLNIQAIPKENVKDDLNIKSSLRVKKWGLFNKGNTDLKVNYITKNYKITDTIPLEVEIDNTNSKMKVVKTKIYLYRKVTLKNKLFVDYYSLNEKITEKKNKILVNKKEKKKFNFVLDLNTIKYDNMNIKDFPYHKKQIKDLLPSLDGNIITCEYSLLVKIKYEHKIEDTPQISLPIYIVHKLSDDHLEKAKEEARKIREDEGELIDDFEIINDNEEKDENKINEEKKEDEKEEGKEEKEEKEEEKKEEKEEEKKEEKKESNENNNNNNSNIMDIKIDKFQYSEGIYQKNFDEFDLINRKTFVNYPSFDDDGNINNGDNNNNDKKNNNNDNKKNINENNNKINDSNKNDKDNNNNKKNLDESNYCLFKDLEAIKK
jgi:hypothetical protein